MFSANQSTGVFGVPETHEEGLGREYVGVGACFDLAWTPIELVYCGIVFWEGFCLGVCANVALYFFFPS